MPRLLLVHEKRGDIAGISGAEMFTIIHRCASSGHGVGDIELKGIGRRSLSVPVRLSAQAFSDLIVQWLAKRFRHYEVTEPTKLSTSRIITDGLTQ